MDGDLPFPILFDYSTNLASAEYILQYVPQLSRVCQYRWSENEKDCRIALSYSAIVVYSSSGRKCVRARSASNALVP